MLRVERPPRLGPLRVAAAEASSAKEPAAHSDTVAETRPCVPPTLKATSSKEQLGGYAGCAELLAARGVFAFSTSSRRKPTSSLQRQVSWSSRRIPLLPRLPPPTLDNVALSLLGTGSEVGLLILLSPRSSWSHHEKLRHHWFVLVTKLQVSLSNKP